MQPMENSAGSKDEWIGEIPWKTKDRIDRSMLGYHGMLFSPICVGYPP